MGPSDRKYSPTPQCRPGFKEGSTAVCNDATDSSDLLVSGRGGESPGHMSRVGTRIDSLIHCLMRTKYLLCAGACAQGSAS